jgi:hypothetical protein
MMEKRDPSLFLFPPFYLIRLPLLNPLPRILLPAVGGGWEEGDYVVNDPV